MPHLSNKRKIIDILIEDAVARVNRLEEETDSNDEEINKIFDELYEDLTMVMIQRQGISSKVQTIQLSREEIFNSINDEKFEELFRVNRTEFHNLLNFLNEDEYLFRTNAKHLSKDLQLAVVLYRLGATSDKNSTNQISEMFGFSDGGIIANITKRVFSSLLRTFRKHIKWPDDMERIEIVINTFHELPYCIGYIDIINIDLYDCPVNRKNTYFSDTTNTYTLKVQLVCDHKYYIRDVGVCHPGSVSNSSILINSIIYQHKADNLTNDQWLAANSKLPLTNITIIPYMPNESIHSEKFNKILLNYSERVQTCIKMLRDRFRSLQNLRLRMNSIKNERFANDWVMVCCLLHNILINNEILNTYSKKCGSSSKQCSITTTTNNTSYNFLMDTKRIDECLKKRDRVCELIVN